jgi:hypothetical protein
MLFDISTNQPISIPDWAEKQMREDFPDFFKGKPVKIKTLDSKMRRSYKVPSIDKEGTPRLFVEPPRGNSRKARGIVVDPETGDEYHIQYSTTSPRPGQFGMEFAYPGNNVTIRHGMEIRPGQKDLLFYVHFICPIISGNRCARKSQDPWYTYDKPEIEAKNKIESARSARELENLIYFDASYETILKAITGLGLNVKDTEEENRVSLHDSIKSGSDTFKKNAFEILGGATKRQQAKSEETIHELINRLSSEGFIKNEDGIWYLRDRRGDGTKWLKNPFFESTGEKDAFALIDHLKVNSELLDKLRKA